MSMAMMNQMTVDELTEFEVAMRPSLQSSKRFNQYDRLQSKIIKSAYVPLW